ncbi:MAG: GNAT family N-acetyltransferase [Clostridia bacterium]|nr:GNAT family N-acetyltransferase [Clostridia bacterium]
MEIAIRKLTSESLNDWLDYFDNLAFTDNDDWCGCYCMCYHWNSELQKIKSWNCDRDCAEFNRAQAIKRILEGTMKGYIAYDREKVVGWCNANDKSAYDNVNFNFPKEVPDHGEKIKSAVCFSVAPGYRGMGIASRLLEHVCKQAKDEGYEYVEAYPFAHNENHAYHGPVSMYEKAGFVKAGEIEGCIVFRKKL